MHTFKDQYIWDVMAKCFDGKTKQVIIKNYVKLCHYLLHQNNIPIKTKKKLDNLLRKKIKEKHRFILPAVVIE